MSTSSVDRKKVISIFGQELGQKLLALVDPCSLTPEDCEMIKACETLTSLTLNNQNPSQLKLTYKDEKGASNILTLNINPGVSALSFASSLPGGGDNLSIILSDGSIIKTEVPEFKFVPNDGIATSSGYNSMSGAFTVDVVISTDQDNAVILGTDGGLYVDKNEGSATLEELVLQTSHGLVVGDVIRSNGTDNEYVKAQADSETNAEVVGIVTEVINLNSFKYTFGGIIDVAAAIPVATPGTVLFLSETTPGALTDTAPTGVTDIQKPLAIVIASNSKMLWINYRGNDNNPYTSASFTVFDNTVTGFTATTVQDAIDEMYALIPAGFGIDTVLAVAETLTANREIDLDVNQLDIIVSDVNQFRVVKKSGGVFSGFQIYDPDTAEHAYMYLSSSAVPADNKLIFKVGTTGYQILELAENGQLTFSKYGINTFTGSLAYLAGFAADGKVLEIDPSSVGTTDHTALSNIGTNTHAQIDSHIGSTSNPHSTSFANLTDTPASYSGQAGKIPAVNGGETGLEFIQIQQGYTAFSGSNVVINNTVAETNIVDITVPANTLIADGNSLAVNMLGLYVNNTGANRNFTLRIKVGGVTVYQDATGNLATSPNTRTVQYIGRIIRTSSTTAEIALIGVIDGTTTATIGQSDFGANATRFSGIVATSSIAWDWTANTQLEFTITHSAADANITYTHDYYLFTSGGLKGEKGDTGAGTDDPDAIHVNESGEINGLTEKVTISDNDAFAIEDSDASYVKKKSLWSTIKSAIATYYNSLTATLTNKTINAANNTISGLTIGTHVTGASTALSDTANITYDADTDASAKGWVIDEDSMVSNLATKVPTQQSVKAYVDALSSVYVPFSGAGSNVNLNAKTLTNVSSISAAAALFGGAANLRSFNVYGTGLDGRLSIQSNSGGNPGVEMTTDGNTTRTLIKHQEVGTSGTQLEFYTQVDGGAISRYITIYENGDVYFHPDGAGATPALDAGIRNNSGVMQYKDSSGSWSNIKDILTGIPQNSKSADYVLVLADANGHIYHPASDANDRTFTIPANASVAYPIGTTVTFVNRSVNNLSIAITTDTMELAGVGTTGTRTLAQYGMATALKLESTVWVINGIGLT